MFPWKDNIHIVRKGEFKKKFSIYGFLSSVDIGDQKLGLNLSNAKVTEEGSRFEVKKKKKSI